MGPTCGFCTLRKMTRDVSGHNHGSDGRFVTVTGTELSRPGTGDTITHIQTPHQTTIGHVETKKERHTGVTHEGRRLTERGSRDEAERDVERSYLHHARRVVGRPRQTHENVLRSYVPGYDPKSDSGAPRSMSAKRLNSMARTAYRLGLHFGNPAAESRMDAPRSEREQSSAIDAIVAKLVPDYTRKTHHEITPDQAHAIVDAAWKHGVGQHKAEPKAERKIAAGLLGATIAKDTAPVPGLELVGQSLRYSRRGKLVRRTAAGRRRGRLAHANPTTTRVSETTRPLTGEAMLRAYKSDGHMLAILKRAGLHLPACECGWEGKKCHTQTYSRMQHRQHVLTKVSGEDSRQRWAAVSAIRRGGGKLCSGMKGCRLPQGHAGGHRVKGIGKVNVTHDEVIERFRRFPKRIDQGKRHSFLSGIENRCKQCGKKETHAIHQGEKTKAVGGSQHRHHRPGGRYPGCKACAAERQQRGAWRPRRPPADLSAITHKGRHLDGLGVEKARRRAVRCTECGERWGHGHRAGATGSGGTSWGGQCPKSTKNSGAHNIVFSRRK